MYIYIYIYIYLTYNTFKWNGPQPNYTVFAPSYIRYYSANQTYFILK